MAENKKKIEDLEQVRPKRPMRSLAEGEHLDAVSTLAELVGDFSSTLDLDETLGDAGPLVLTPHPGELERLTGASASDRDAQVSVAKSFAERTGAVMVVKGGPTVVVSRERVWTNATGNPGMATAGSGDVLTGHQIS